MASVRKVLALGLALAMPACGSVPALPSTAPSTSTGAGTVFGEGTFVIDLIGDSKACGDIKIPQAGTAVSVAIAGSVVNGEWVGRAAVPEGGAFELRLRFDNQPPPPSAGPNALSVAGTFSGTAVDSYVYLPGLVLRGTSAVFGSGAQLDGALQWQTFAKGTVAGNMAFTRNGVTSTCPPGAVGWTINGPMGK